MVFPTNYLEKKERIHQVEDLMRRGHWRDVLEVFQVPMRIFLEKFRIFETSYP
jgi:hypothetical protein